MSTEDIARKPTDELQHYEEEEEEGEEDGHEKYMRFL